MITQTEVNTAFLMGEQRMFDVCELIDDDLLGHSEIAGMLMGAMRVHSKRLGKSLFEAAVELAELIDAADIDDD